MAEEDRTIIREEFLTDDGATLTIQGNWVPQIRGWHITVYSDGTADRVRIEPAIDTPIHVLQNFAEQITAPLRVAIDLTMMVLQECKSVMGELREDRTALHESQMAEITALREALYESAPKRAPASEQTKKEALAIVHTALSHITGAGSGPSEAQAQLPSPADFSPDRARIRQILLAIGAPPESLPLDGDDAALKKALLDFPMTQAMRTRAVAVLTPDDQAFVAQVWQWAQSGQAKQ